MDQIQAIASSLAGGARAAAGGFASMFAILGPFQVPLAFLAGLAVLIAATRLLARTAMGPDFVLERSDYDSLKFHRVIGAALAMGASALWTWAGVAAAPGAAGGPPAGSAMASAVLALGAVPLLGLGLGCRLRIEVDVIGKDGTADSLSSRFVLGLMEKIGSGRPRGLQYPHSTDASAFAGAMVTSAPEASWVKALLAAVRLISFTPPWQIDVALMAQEAVAVQITRNGRKADSDVIVYSELFPHKPADSTEEDRKRALLTAAACFILLALADSYPHMRDGLAGARYWRSVAFQVLAGSQPWSEDPEENRRLLAEAVEEDPHNKAAWLGYLQATGGFFGSSRQSLKAMVASLEDLKKALRDDHAEDRTRDFDLSLEIRLLYSLAFAYSNLRLREGRDGQSSVVHQGLETAAELIEDIKRATAPQLKGTPMCQFATRLQPVAGLIYLHLMAMQGKAHDPLRPHTNDHSALAKEWSEGIENSSLNYLYNRACWRVEEGDGQNVEESLRDLELAVGLEDLRGPQPRIPPSGLCARTGPFSPSPEIAHAWSPWTL